MLNMCVTGWMAIDLPATIDLREIQDFIFLVLLCSIVLYWSGSSYGYGYDWVLGIGYVYYSY
jgi:hypothetical protein